MKLSHSMISWLLMGCRKGLRAILRNRESLCSESDHSSVTSVSASKFGESRKYSIIIGIRAMRCPVSSLRQPGCVFIVSGLCM